MLLFIKHVIQTSLSNTVSVWSESEIEKRISSVLLLYQNVTNTVKFFQPGQRADPKLALSKSVTLWCNYKKLGVHFGCPVIEAKLYDIFDRCY